MMIVAQVKKKQSQDLTRREFSKTVWRRSLGTVVGRNAEGLDRRRVRRGRSRDDEHPASASSR